MASTQKFLAKNSLLVSAVTGLSTLLGFIRDSTIAFKFGASGLTDAFFIAMVIPMLFVNLIKGTITNAYITVYNAYLAAGQSEEGWKMTNILLSFFAILLSLIVVVSLFGARWLVLLVAPSYTGAQLTLAIELSRILLPSMLFTGLLGILVGINNAHNSFLAPSATALVSNVFTIISIFTLGSLWGIYGLTIGSLLGMVAQFVIQIPSALKHGFHFKFAFDFQHPGVKKITKLVAPFILSQAAVQVNLIVDRALATGLPAGVVSALNFANRLVFLPQTIFTFAIATVLFPLISRAAARSDWQGLLESLVRAVRLSTLILLPAAAGLFVLRYPLVQILFQHGAFSFSDTVLTANTMPYFLGALYFGGIVPLLTNVYYGTEKVFVAVRASVISIGLNILFSLALILPLKQNGLALANSLSALVNVILLTRGLYKIIPAAQRTVLFNTSLFSFLARIIAAVGIMMLSINLFMHLVATNLLHQPGLVLCSLGAILLGMVVFMVATFLLRIEEVQKGIFYLINRIRPA